MKANTKWKRKSSTSRHHSSFLVTFSLYFWFSHYILSFSFIQFRSGFNNRWLKYSVKLSHPISYCLCIWLLKHRGFGCQFMWIYNMFFRRFNFLHSIKNIIIQYSPLFILFNPFIWRMNRFAEHRLLLLLSRDIKSTHPAKRALIYARTVNVKWIRGVSDSFAQFRAQVSGRLTLSAISIITHRFKWTWFHTSASNRRKNDRKIAQQYLKGPNLT